MHPATKIFLIMLSIFVGAIVIVFFLFRNSPEFMMLLGISLFLGGSLVDTIGTYLGLKRYENIPDEELQRFGYSDRFDLESNDIAKACMRKFGVIKGSLLAEVHPKHIFALAVTILFFSLPIFSLKYFLLHDPLHNSLVFAMTMAFSLVGAGSLVAGVRNFIWMPIWDSDWSLKYHN